MGIYLENINCGHVAQLLHIRLCNYKTTTDLLTKWNFFKPKYKHSNPTIRRQAVKRLTSQKTLIRIAKEEKDLVVRTEAVKKLNNQRIIIDIPKLA